MERHSRRNGDCLREAVFILPGQDAPHVRIISPTPYRGVQNRANLHDKAILSRNDGRQPAPTARRRRWKRNDERRRPGGRREPAGPGGQMPRVKRGARQNSRFEGPAFPQPSVREEGQVASWRRAGTPLLREMPRHPASASIACASANPGRLGKRAAAMLAEARIPPTDPSADGAGAHGQRRAWLTVALAAPYAALAHGLT